jgi:hypothetical protein
MADCDPHLADPFAFPRRPSNRAALDRFGYRIGDYATMREAMIRHIDTQAELAAWTHRGADDPAIALLEGAAILGDILSFYQERYGNEAFLRTAAWRESVADLVRLTGYRLAPALGGKTTLAVELRGTVPVTIPSGFAFKAEIEGADKPAEFRTDAALVAHPHLSRFRLYRKRRYVQALPEGVTELEVETAGGTPTEAAIAALGLTAGDRLMLVPPPPAWVTGGTSFAATQGTAQTLEVAEVRQVLDRTLVRFDTGLERSWSGPVAAYRLGRSFRHFGHAAPHTYTENQLDASKKITGALERSTAYVRHADVDCIHTSADRRLPDTVIPLDREVTDLIPGRPVVIEARIAHGGQTKTLVVARTIRSARATSMRFAAQTGPATWLELDAALITHSGLSSPEADIRDIRVHEVLGPEIALRRVSRPLGGKISSGLKALNFLGTPAEARALAGRRLTLLCETDGAVQTLTNTNTVAEFAGEGGRQLWTLSFDAAPRFRREAFDEEAPAVLVFGNLVEASEGKLVPRTVLGTGDARAAFQSFALPKPLTYRLSPGATPPQVPELTVYVNDRAWTRVASLYGQPSDAQVYIVREDTEGKSWVQFGDGKTGARLPSGRENVSAEFRTGAGARGPLKPDTTPTPDTRLPQVKALALPEGVSGGADREPADNARQAAPGRVQGLGRLVSLMDYEAELMTIPSVARVRADWDLADGVPTVVLRVLVERGREAEFDAIEATIRQWQRCRGPDRFALAVEQAFLREVWIDLSYGRDPRVPDTVAEAQIRAVLAPSDRDGVDEAGLFALRARRLGAPEYASRIEGRVQRVEGVQWARVTGLGMFSAAASRSGALLLPAAPRARAKRIAPAAGELLSLLDANLSVQAAPSDTVEDCA